MAKTAKCNAIAPRGPETTPGQKAMLQRLQSAKGIEAIRNAINGWQNGKRPIIFIFLNVLKPFINYLCIFCTQRI